MFIEQNVEENERNQHEKYIRLAIKVRKNKQTMIHLNSIHIFCLVS